MSHTPDFSELTTSVLNQIIRQRRTLKPEKMDAARPVSKAIIEQMLYNANWAPTHGLNEPWRFKVFTGKVRKELGVFLSQCYQNFVSPEKFQATKYEKIKQRPLIASHIIAICMKRQEKTKIPVLEDIEAVACAVQNMHLTATAYGVAAYWNSAAFVYGEEMKAFLGLGAEDRCLGFLYVGYSTVAWPVGKRKPIEDKVEWME